MRHKVYVFAHTEMATEPMQEIPDKLYKDCHRCPRQNNCDEVAMVRGELPQFAILQPPATQFVKLEW